MNFFERFFSLNLKDFGGADLPIGLIMLCLCIGMIAATIMIQYTNATIYKCIKALVRHKATTPETAKTLKELGLSGERRVLRALRNKNAMLMRFIAERKEAPDTTEAETETAQDLAAAPEKAPAEPKEKPDPNETVLRAEYYLSPENSDRAKEILEGSEDTLWHTVGYCAIFVLLFFGLVWLLPIILPIVL